MFYQGCEGKVIKQICKEFPNIGGTVFADAFIIKTIDLGDLSRLVIAPQHKDSVGVADLEAYQHGDCLYTVIPTINVITHEQVVGVWGTATDSKEFH